VVHRLRPGGTLVFQTLTMPGDLPDPPHPEDRPLNEREPLLRNDFPKLAFFEHRWAGDRTNWFAPNAAAVEAMLRSGGMTRIRRLAEETWLAEKPADDEAARVEAARCATWWKPDLWAKVVPEASRRETSEASRR
jgi:tRNA (mo5U34)-methyltransferase